MFIFIKKSPSLLNSAQKYIGLKADLVVMGGDSCSKGREFESRFHILDGHFSHLFVVKIVMFV